MQITQYLTTKEMASCKWKKETMLKHVEDKKKLETAFRNIYVKDKYFTNAELKEILRQEFTKLGITLTPKATLIRECKLYDVTQKKSGYLFGSYKFDFSLKL